MKCLIWIAILTLMCSRGIPRLIQNANPENANRYTHLRWAKVFTEQAERLLTEVLECVGLKLEPICSLYTTFTSARDASQMSNERGSRPNFTGLGISLNVPRICEVCGSKFGRSEGGATYPPVSRPERSEGKEAEGFRRVQGEPTI